MTYRQLTHGDGAARLAPARAWTRPEYTAGFRYDDHTIFATQPGGATPAALPDAATGGPRPELGDSHQHGEVILRTDGDGRLWVSVPDAAGLVPSPLASFGTAFRSVGVRQRPAVSRMRQLVA
ncbi:hypothetical protein ACWKSP_07890 [Micromonosporaceae bacterium Da 78-11]